MYYLCMASKHGLPEATFCPFAHLVNIRPGTEAWLFPVFYLHTHITYDYMIIHGHAHVDIYIYILTVWKKFRLK